MTTLSLAKVRSAPHAAERARAGRSAAYPVLITGLVLTVLGYAAVGVLLVQLVARSLA